VSGAPDGGGAVPYRLDVARVLLVEDDAAIAEPLSRALRRHGCSVEIVASGRDALARWSASA